MSLPGLDMMQLSTAQAVQDAPPLEVDLAAGSEWRFEIGFEGAGIKVKVLNGTAELFGTELAPNQTYSFTGMKAAIYTWHGCTLHISDGQNRESRPSPAILSEYTADETPMVDYANVHFGLETLRQHAQAQAREGPRVLILGPPDVGKTSLTKILTAYAMKMGRVPVVVNLDQTEGMLSVPGTVSAVAWRGLLDVEGEGGGWGSSPMSGPAGNVPVRLPLVYSCAVKDPMEKAGWLYKGVIQRLGVSVAGRLAEDAEARETGIIVDTPGSLSSAKGDEGLDIIQSIVSDFSISTILVLGSERLYSRLAKTFSAQQTSTSTSMPETINVLKLSSSGGCVDRDAAFLTSCREASIRQYFFGKAVNLSPHAQYVDWEGLSIWKATSARVGGDDVGNGDFLPGDEDEYQPPEDYEDDSANVAGNGSGANDDPLVELNTTSSSPGFTMPPLSLENSVVAITQLKATGSRYSPTEVRNSSVMGFVYVAEVDEKRKRLRVLAPVAGVKVSGWVWVWGGEGAGGDLGRVVGLIG